MSRPHPRPDDTESPASLFPCFHFKFPHLTQLHSWGCDEKFQKLRAGAVVMVTGEEVWSLAVWTSVGSQM
jgi:hypothetical protein